MVQEPTLKSRRKVFSWMSMTFNWVPSMEFWYQMEKFIVGDGTNMEIVALQAWTMCKLVNFDKLDLTFVIVLDWNLRRWTCPPTQMWHKSLQAQDIAWCFVKRMTLAANKINKHASSLVSLIASIKIPKMCQPRIKIKFDWFYFSGEFSFQDHWSASLDYEKFNQIIWENKAYRGDRQCLQCVTTKTSLNRLFMFSRIKLDDTRAIGKN